MNERIKELAKQSLPEFYLTNCPSALEKFAELIVRECLKEIKDMLVDDCEQIYPDKKTTEYVNDRLLDAHDNIAEHFGVEE